MRITLIPMIAMIGSTFLHVILCFIFVEALDTGVVGLAYASSIKDFILLLSVMIYSRCSSQVNKALVPVNWDSFQGWYQYLSISLPSTVMMCAEWWAAQVFMILAGTLGVTEVASYTIVVNVHTAIMMIPIGI